MQIFKVNTIEIIFFKKYGPNLLDISVSVKTLKSKYNK